MNANMSGTSGNLKPYLGSCVLPVEPLIVTLRRGVIKCLIFFEIGLSGSYQP